MHVDSRRLLIHGSRAAIILALSLPLAILLLILQTAPLVPTESSLNAAEVSRIERLLIDSAPADVRSTQLKELSLTDGELNLLIRYAADLFETDRPLTGQIQLPGNLMQAEASVPVLSRPLTLYLNLSAEFSANGEELNLESLKLGHLRIPGGLVNNLARALERRYLAESRSYLEFAAMLDSLRHIEIAQGRLDVDLMWEPALISQIRNQAQRLLVSEADQLRIARHYRQLAAVVDAVPETTRAITLATLLQPMFANAEVQSGRSSQAIAENRTLLLTVAAYVNEEEIGQWLDPDITATLPHARPIEVRIQRRQDLAQHVASSAAIAAAAGAGVAQVLSSIKENYDARYRSGYSFSDLTANTAGMTIGRLATQSESSAVALQRRMGRLSDDSEYLPQLDSNRDGLSEADFNSLYGDNDGAGLRSRTREIEALIAAQPLISELLANH